MVSAQQHMQSFNGFRNAATFLQQPGLFRPLEENKLNSILYRKKFQYSCSGTLDFKYKSCFRQCASLT